MPTSTTPTPAPATPAPATPAPTGYWTSHPKLKKLRNWGAIAVLTSASLWGGSIIHKEMSKHRLRVEPHGNGYIVGNDDTCNAQVIYGCKRGETVVTLYDEIREELGSFVKHNGIAIKIGDLDKLIESNNLTIIPTSDIPNPDELFEAKNKSGSTMLYLREGPCGGEVYVVIGKKVISNPASGESNLENLTIRLDKNFMLANGGSTVSDTLYRKRK